MPFVFGHAYEVGANSSKTFKMYAGLVGVMRDAYGLYGIFWGNTVQTYVAGTGVTITASGSQVTVTNGSGRACVVITLGEIIT